MNGINEITYHVPFTSDSSLAAGFHVSAALGGERRTLFSSIQDRSASWCRAKRAARLPKS